MSIFQELHDDVFELLNTKLSDKLKYHSPEHTAHVIEKAEFISRQENVGGKDLFLVKVAALFHDIGFIQQRKNHEEAGCVICTEKLTNRNFDKNDIALICGMIMATKIPQSPTTLLEKIVADADLEYLGTDLYYPISQNLFLEFKNYNPELTIHKFDEIQANFMRRHHYHTDYCKTHLEAKKQQHLKEILSTM
jgi:predicted metal-dependent HD superfamily phosphohydrolase